MTLRKLGANVTEIETASATVLFSYNTPVAACMKDGTGFIRTDCRWSRTTSKHINQWLDGAKAREVPQAELNALIGG